VVKRKYGDGARRVSLSLSRYLVRLEKISLGSRLCLNIARWLILLVSVRLFPPEPTSAIIITRTIHTIANISFVCQPIIDRYPHSSSMRCHPTSKNHGWTSTKRRPRLSLRSRTRPLRPLPRPFRTPGQTCSTDENPRHKIKVFTNGNPGRTPHPERKPMSPGVGASRWHPGS
jgi:hypothetical protein